MTKDELLNYASANGILDIESISRQYDVEKYLNQHQFSIWQSKNGRWYSYLPTEEGGRKQVVKTNREDLESLIIEFYKNLEQNPTIKDIFDDWIAQKCESGSIKRSTKDRYEQCFKAYLTGMSNRRVKDISGLDIEDYLVGLVSRTNMARKTYNNIKTLLRGMLTRARKQGYINFNIKDVLDDIEIPNQAFKSTKTEDGDQIFYEDEEQKIVSYLIDNPDSKNLALLLMFKTGMRIGEVVSLKREDISDNTVYVHRTETRYKDEDGNDVFDVDERPKTKAGVRHIILKDEYEWLLDLLRSRVKDGDWLFIHNGRRCTSQIVRRRMSWICRKLEIPPRGTHKIRKTYGTKLYDSNAPESLICEQMGHTDISCLKKHYYYSRQREKEKAQMINDIPGL